ncbi:MAG: histidine phosphatase family protein [Chloroflexota bacterium]|nr:histidine phosphatase family protein [Chloroflexota bacterium]
MDLTRIVLIRHGCTEWNEGEGERFRGRAEIELSEFGLRQAKAAAVSLSRWKADAIYSSPLRRALATAQILASPFGLEVTPLTGLTDIDYGSWQGLSLREAQTQDRLLYQLWQQSPHLVTFPEGENLVQVRERAATGVNNTLAKHVGKTIVLVSHKVVCKVLLCYFLGLDNSHFWQMEQDTAAISIVELRDDVFVLKLLNDTCHLK